VKDAFLTIEEAAELLRISPRSAYTLARESGLAGAVKVGNQWRVDRDALMAWVKEEGRATNPSETPTDNPKKDSGQ
jgi:excisionase family DNA binding protein